MLHDADARRKVGMSASTEAVVTSLRTEPAGRIHSLDELFALAYAIEASAAVRYDETAKRFAQQGASHLADVFERLAEIERSHMEQVRIWAVEQGKNAPADIRPPWPIPNTFDASLDELAQSKLLTPYRALASAVRHEERSFAFWTYVAAHATRAEVKRAAERMALEELERVSLLRRERRKAFHAQRSTSGPIEITVDAAMLAGEERRLAGLIEQGPDLFLEDSEFAREMARASREAAAKLDALLAAYHPKLLVPKLPAELSDDPSAVSELLVEAYLTLADTATNANVVRAAQELAGPAIYRLSTLRSGLESGTETAAWQAAATFAKRKRRRETHRKRS
jgi:rubrerythrin